jgi:hypothetical protein
MTDAANYFEDYYLEMGYFDVDVEVYVAYGYNESGYVNGDGNSALDQYVSAHGIAAPDLSIAAAIRLVQQVARPSGIFDAAGGSPAVWNWLTRARPAGIDASAVFGSPHPWRWRQDVGGGAINTAAYGKPTLVLMRQYQPLAGFSTLASGALTIELRTRYLKPGGFNRLYVGGDTSATLEIRNLYPSGVSLLATGGPWVSDSPRYVEVGEGFKTSAFGTPLMGYGQTAIPFGWDGLRFGTRIVPEVQYCYPRGIAGVFGSARIWTRTQTVSPAGFLPDVREEYRWGASKVWNWARFITQYAQTDDSTSLDPPVMSKYVTVENRNRTIATFATSPHPLPSPAVENKARTVKPAGVAAPALTLKMVSHRVRTYRLEGIDSIRFEKYHTIYNAARVLAPAGFVTAGYGRAASVVNTRRSFTIYSNLNALAMGSPMVAYRVRTVKIPTVESIAPPTLKGPEVKLWRHYVAPTGFSRLGWEAPSLRIHWTIFYPDGIRSVTYGSPTVKNKTPQLYAYGHDSRIFGTPAVRTQWRRYALDGISSLAFGNTVIKDRRQWIYPSGVNKLLMGTKLRAEKTTEDPPATQKVFPRGLETLKFDGTVALNQQVVYAAGFSALAAGSPDMQANGIRIDSGVGSFACGTVTVSLWIRTLTASSVGQSQEFDTSNYPRMSPWTIWAPNGAPAEALKWGKAGNYIDVGGDSRNPGIKLGSPVVTNRHRFLTASSLGTLTAAGTPTLTLRRQYIKPAGYAPSRHGYQTLGPFPQTAEQLGDDVETPDTTYGKPTVTIHYTGPQTIAGQGIDLGRMGALDIENFNRRVYPAGTDNAGLGASGREIADGYTWQTLHVGSPMPTIPTGWDSQSFGTAWVSLKIRDVRATGFDAFTSDYTLDAFDSRMKVKQAAVVIASQRTATNGFTALAVATPDIKLKTQYIRPDGNAETYRKGAPLS